MGSLGKGGIGRGLVAVAPVVAEVARHIVMHCSAGAVGAGGVHHCRQGFVIDLDQLGGVLGLPLRLGNDQGYLVTDMAHLALRQARVGRLLHWRTVLVVDQPAAGQAVDFGIGQILPGEDGDHTGGFLGSVELDRFDACMRVR